MTPGNSNGIRIRISFTGLIDIKNFKNNSMLAIESGKNIDNVLDMLGIKQQHKRFLITLINDKSERQTYVLKDDDHLSLFLPVGGG